MMNYKERFYKHYGLEKCDIVLCVICLKPAVNLHHIKYKSQGGTDDPSNLAPLCFEHHHSHHTRNKPTTEEIKTAKLLNFVPF